MFGEVATWKLMVADAAFAAYANVASKNGNHRIKEQHEIRYLSSVDEYSDPALLAGLAQEAEEKGWDGVFVFDLIGQPRQAADPWSDIRWVMEGRAVQL